VLGDDQRSILIAGGIAPDRIYLKRDVSPVEIRGDEVPIRSPGQLKGLQVLLYSGNYSVAHDSDTVVGGLIKHHSEGTGSFGLWLNAIGSRADLVEQQLREAGIPAVRHRPRPLAGHPNRSAEEGWATDTLADSTGAAECGQRTTSARASGTQ